MYEIDPLRDSRWPRFLERHSQATVFHSPEWLEALSRTYGYRSGVLTSTGPDRDLVNGLVFCRVKSWLTGRRVVSLPFSDHCTPLVDRAEELVEFLAKLKQDRTRGKYVEIRCLAGQPAAAAGLAVAAAYCLHRLDLSPSHDEILRGFHANHVRRKIARAEREGLTYEEGRSELLLQKFYRLALLTRRRHHLPPQPLAWFRNLIACMGDRLKIRLASYQGRPAAGTLTLRYKSTMTYKYGFSDVSFHRLGSMQLLLWRAIQEAKSEGLAAFDMGRTDWANPGLIAFKDHWGAARKSVVYLRDPARELPRGTGGLAMRLASQAFTLVPDSLLTAAGNLLYRHMA